MIELRSVIYDINLENLRKLNQKYYKGLYNINFVIILLFREVDLEIQATPEYKVS